MSTENLLLSKTKPLNKTGLPDLNNEDGSTMLEFAIIIPVLSLLIFGIIQFSLMFDAMISIRNAAAVGARNIILHNGNSGTAIQAARDSIPPSLDKNLANISTSAHASGGTQISITYPYPMMIPLPIPGASGGIFNLQSEAIMK